MGFASKQEWLESASLACERCARSERCSSAKIAAAQPLMENCATSEVLALPRCFSITCKNSLGRCQDPLIFQNQSMADTLCQWKMPSGQPVCFALEQQGSSGCAALGSSSSVAAWLQHTTLAGKVLAKQQALLKVSSFVPLVVRALQPRRSDSKPSMLLTEQWQQLAPLVRCSGSQHWRQPREKSEPFATCQKILPFAALRPQAAWSWSPAWSHHALCGLALQELPVLAAAQRNPAPQGLRAGAKPREQRQASSCLTLSSHSFC